MSTKAGKSLTTFVPSDPGFEDWVTVNPEAPRLLNAHSQRPHEQDRVEAGAPSASGLARQLQPLLPPVVVAGADMLNGHLRAQAPWVMPLVACAGNAGAALGTLALESASQLIAEGPSEAQRLAAQACQKGAVWAENAQERLHWLGRQSHRSIAEAWYTWLEKNDYIQDGALKSKPQLDVITKVQHMRREPVLSEPNIAEWKNYCEALNRHEGPLTPFILAGLMSAAAN